MSRAEFHDFMYNSWERQFERIFRSSPRRDALHERLRRAEEGLRIGGKTIREVLATFKDPEPVRVAIATYIRSVKGGRPRQVMDPWLLGQLSEAVSWGGTFFITHGKLVLQIPCEVVP